MKRKQRIYLDTSIISYLDQKYSPEKMAVTHKLWEKILADEYDVVISEIVDWEIDDCDEDKKKILKKFENQLQGTIVIMFSILIKTAMYIIQKKTAKIKIAANK